MFNSKNINNIESVDWQGEYERMVEHYASLLIGCSLMDGQEDLIWQEYYSFDENAINYAMNNKLAANNELHQLHSTHPSIRQDAILHIAEERDSSACKKYVINKHYSWDEVENKEVEKYIASHVKEALSPIKDDIYWELYWTWYCDHDVPKEHYFEKPKVTIWAFDNISLDYARELLTEYFKEEWSTTVITE